MPGQRIDWRRAKPVNGVGNSAEEIRDDDARYDVAFLERRRAERIKAAQKRTPRKRKSKFELAVAHAMQRPDRQDEARLWAILNGGTFQDHQFQRQHFFPTADRAFVCDALQLRIVAEASSSLESLRISPGAPIKFKWRLILVPAKHVMNDGFMVAALIADVLNAQKQLKERTKNDA